MSDPTSTGADGIPIEDILDALEADPDRVLVRNEFAVVGVTLHKSGGDRSRLRIEDLRTRQAVELDALELESLAWATHDDLSPLLDPSQSRWVGTGE